MLIRALRPLTGIYGHLQAGMTSEIDDRLARDLIGAGLAEASSEMGLVPVPLVAIAAPVILAGLDGSLSDTAPAVEPLAILDGLLSDTVPAVEAPVPQADDARLVPSVDVLAPKTVRPRK